MPNDLKFGMSIDLCMVEKSDCQNSDFNLQVYVTCLFIRKYICLHSFDRSILT